TLNLLDVSKLQKLVRPCLLSCWGNLDIEPELTIHARKAGSPRHRTRRRYLATVRSETPKPSFRSSPWIFGAPQPTFSAAIRRRSVRIFSLTLGRPLRGRDRQRQYRRKPAPMPADHGLRFHNDQDIRPSRPYVPQTGPEKASKRFSDRGRLRLST